MLPLTALKAKALWGGKTLFFKCTVTGLLSACTGYTGERIFSLVSFSMPAVRMMYLRKLLYLEELHYRHLRLPDASGHRHLKNLHPFWGVFIIPVFFCHLRSVLYHKRVGSNIHSGMSCSSIVLSLTLVMFHSLAWKTENDEWPQCFLITWLILELSVRAVSFHYFKAGHWEVFGVFFLNTRKCCQNNSHKEEPLTKTMEKYFNNIKFPFLVWS